jgi:hypothetical protein
MLPFSLPHTPAVELSRRRFRQLLESWIVDVAESRLKWGLVFFVCHDSPAAHALITNVEDKGWSWATDAEEEGPNPKTPSRRAKVRL